jgi:hypothetical protein
MSLKAKTGPRPSGPALRKWLERFTGNTWQRVREVRETDFTPAGQLQPYLRGAGPVRVVTEHVAQD